jgi:hypothetical protein
MRTVENTANPDTGHVVYLNLKGANIAKFEFPTYGAATRKVVELEEQYDENVYDIVYRDERVFIHPANNMTEEK